MTPIRAYQHFLVEGIPLQEGKLPQLVPNSKKSVGAWYKQTKGDKV
jgi:hypothetical protein